MVHCPKCNMLIGESIKTCPGCKTVFTGDELGIIEEEVRKNEKELAEATEQAFEEFLKKRKRFLIALLIVMIMMFTIPWVVLANTTSSAIVMGTVIFFCVLEVAVIVVGTCTGATVCPHCGASLFRNNGRHCSYCGGHLSR